MTRNRGRFFTWISSFKSSKIQQHEELPDLHCLTCPLTHAIMSDPVVDREGCTYERSAILKWLRTNPTSPITRNALDESHLSTNFKVKECIDQYSQLQSAIKDSIERVKKCDQRDKAHKKASNALQKALLNAEAHFQSTTAMYRKLEELAVARQHERERVFEQRLEAFKMERLALEKRNEEMESQLATAYASIDAIKKRALGGSREEVDSTIANTLDALARQLEEEAGPWRTVESDPRSSLDTPPKSAVSTTG